jgi:hypothetical protein
VGVFPSNFVEVLPDSFRPTSRSTSPLPPSNTPSPNNTPQKTKTFRKPFEAYAKAPHYTTAKQPEVIRPTSQMRSRENSGNSFANSLHENIDPVPTPPQTHGYGSRAVSPAPSFQYKPYRPGVERGESPPPPAPPPHRHVARNDSGGSFDNHSNLSRHGSHTSYNDQNAISRHGSHASYDNRNDMTRHAHHVSYDSRNDLSRHGSHASFENHVNVSRNGSHASYDNRNVAPHHQSSASFSNHAPLRQGSFNSYDNRQDEYLTPRKPSPCPPSPAGSHMTPSPLREAMDGVIEQLDALGMSREPESPKAPLDPWSPECFDMVTHRARKKAPQRPLTSMGIPHQDEGYETWSGESSQNPSFQNGYREEPHQLPQLSNYVERMENRLRKMHQHSGSSAGHDEPPQPPPKNQPFERPKSSMAMGPPVIPERKLRHRKSAYDVGRSVLGRTFTTKTNSTSASSGNRSTTTNNSSTTQSSNRSLMSGVSASGISATSAGSLARRNEQRAQSAFGMRDLDMDRPETPFTGVTYHSSHASGTSRSQSQMGWHDDSSSGLGGLVQPKAPKRSIFKKLLDSAKTGVASGRSSIAAGGGDSVKSSPLNRSLPPGVSSIGSGRPMSGMGNSPFAARDAAREMGLSNGVDWVQVRRDVNRSNSLSRNERSDRRDRCQMLDYPALNPVDELYESINGNEGANGMPLMESTNYQVCNLSQVDKNSRFISSLPPMTTAITLATTYVCRPYRSDVQRLRSIFTYVSEKICWEEDFDGEIDTRRTIQSKRGCAEEYAVLVLEMCSAIGIQCELVRGYLKTPGEIPETGIMPRSNHWWNAVLVDNEWRMMDCCLASPSYPRRHLYSSTSSSTADPWWFLTEPVELCWTHIPEHHAQQHICPPVAHEILLNLPCACPPFFKNELEMVDYDTSLTRIEDLEMVHIKFNVPSDIEIAAEVEVRAYTRDSDGDLFESGEINKKRALAQAEWFNGVKRYTVKALLPGDEGQGILKIYAGKRGLMHSIKDIPHPLAFALPIIHTGENPPYDFVTRHPTPHAQRHDIYVVQPQCQRLALNNTFVFAIRQHPSSVSGGAGSTMTPSSNPGGTSPIPFARPGSAMSMTASSASGSNPSTTSSGYSGRKPAKLAIQTPGGKILRLMRKEERKGISVGGRSAGSADEEAGDGGTWETIIKCSERGVWRGLVLADRTARWCVFAEWVCMG